MAGYVAVAVLAGVRIQAARSAGRPAPAGPRLASAVDGEPPVEDVRVVRSLSSAQLRERAAGLRRTWDQTTFYLFDPESWR
jgi:hypothetical protein